MIGGGVPLLLLSAFWGLIWALAWGRRGGCRYRGIRDHLLSCELKPDSDPAS